VLVPADPWSDSRSVPGYCNTLVSSDRKTGPYFCPGSCGSVTKGSGFSLTSKVNLFTKNDVLQRCMPNLGVITTNFAHDIVTYSQKRKVFGL